MGAYWRAHSRADRFERMFHEARNALTADVPYRAVTGDDPDLVAMLGAVSADERELVACGFVVVGDFMAQTAERAPLSVMRGLVDRSGTTCAILGVACAHPTYVQLTLGSYAEHEMFKTRRGLQHGLAEPPSVHRRGVAPELPHDQIVAAHREFACADEAALVHVTSRDELIAQLDRFRARLVSWRASQPPDDLLDADLRSMFGARFNLAATVWARRLRARPPRATARRV
jgi:hypothetical protein